jgi:hypothetical protein
MESTLPRNPVGATHADVKSAVAHAVASPTESMGFSVQAGDNGQVPFATHGANQPFQNMLEGLHSMSEIEAANGRGVCDSLEHAGFPNTTRDSPASS